MSKQNHQTYIDPCKQWLQGFVIHLGLCPFAKLPFINDRIRYVVVEVEDTEQQLTAFWKEIETLKETKPKVLSTTLVIFPNQFNDFRSYLEFFDLAESLLENQGEFENFQLASFHPDYQFAGTQTDAASNYTNRSPFPIVHILRADEVAEAIEQHHDTSKIPERNIQLMEEMGVEKILRMLSNDH